MNWLAFAFLFVAVVAGSAGLTGVVRRYALRRLLDIPNERSSHAQPTPRGGGLAIVVAAFAAGGVMAALGTGNATQWLALAGGIPIAAVGFWDDHRDVPARWRFLTHALLASAAVYLVGGLPPLPVAGHDVALGWVGHVLAAFGLVWVLNLYNFMDGIDGLAGAEALSVTVGAAGLLLLSGSTDNAQAALLFAATVAGFLAWNWPPARIFMGDVGSSFVGFVLGVFALATAARGELSVWPWLILLGVSIVDATYTLFRRMLTGQRWYAAHRSHAYQHAARRFGHRRTTLAVAAINIVWLWPLAWAATRWVGAGVVFLGIAYVPLFAVAVFFRAGAVPGSVQPSGQLGSQPLPPG